MIIGNLSGALISLLSEQPDMMELIEKIKLSIDVVLRTVEMQLDGSMLQFRVFPGMIRLSILTPQTMEYRITIPPAVGSDLQMLIFKRMFESMLYGKENQHVVREFEIAGILMETAMLDHLDLPGDLKNIMIGNTNLEACRRFSRA